MDKPQFVYTVYIRTTPEKLWQALIEPEFTQLYWSGMKLKSDWKVGSPVQMTDAEGAPADNGVVLRFEPPRVLSYSWHVSWHPELKNEPPCRATFEIGPAPQKGVVRLTITHDEFEVGSKTYEGVKHGWPAVLSSLKSLLETGEPLPAEKFSIREYLDKFAG
jgi:uncharacterized protein YndB with AHSA1/START domain